MDGLINRAWKLAARPQGTFKPGDFAWAEDPVPEAGDGQVLVRTVFLSLDPTNRGWANAAATYLPPVPLGSVMRGFGVGVVESSRDPALQPGDYVQGMLGWQSYAVVDGAAVTRFERAPGVPLDAYPAVFSYIGATAYFGVNDIGRPVAGETMVVTGAAGAVGSLAGQIGRILGCRVVGIAGSDEKCAWLTGELGFDAAINYKRESVVRRLRLHCPKGIDVIFENVGGEIFDAELSMINVGARVALCGLISQYNEGVPPPGPRFFGNVLIKRARIEGFIVLDYAHRFPEAFAALGTWMAQGRLRYRTDIVDGLEHAATAVNRLFEGANTGKLLVRVSPDVATSPATGPVQ
jgi:NADPH-dependent curcumin reductase